LNDVEAFSGQAIGGRSEKEMIKLVSASKRVHALVVRTPIMYEGLGRYMARIRLGVTDYSRLRCTKEGLSQSQLGITKFKC